jgi:hypothetical protein
VREAESLVQQQAQVSGQCPPTYQYLCTTTVQTRKPFEALEQSVWRRVDIAGQSDCQLPCIDSTGINQCFKVTSTSVCGQWLAVA